jgi:hypothetical protein
MSVYIQSRKVGRKRWETHIPPITRGFMVSAEDRAAKRLEELKSNGNPEREYRLYSGATK